MNNTNEIVKIDDGIYQIKYYWLGLANVYCFLVVGSQRALLIDTCYSTTDAMSYVRTVTDLPVDVVCTHGHFDHVGGVGDFPQVYLSTKDLEVAREHTDYSALSKMIARYKQTNKLIGLLLKFKKFRIPMEASLHIGKTEFLPLPDQGYFDLGDRKVSFVETPGHTPGSICLMDSKTGCFFTGDMACQEGVLLGFEYSTSVTDYRASVEKMKDYYFSNGGKKIIPAHHSLPAKEDVFDILIDLCSKILSGEVVGKPHDDGLSTGMAAADNSATIIYQRL